MPGGCMNRTIYALIVGIVMYVLVIYLAYIQRDLTGSQLILMLAAPFVMGVLSGGIEKGLINGFLLSFVMLMLEAIIIQSGGICCPQCSNGDYLHDGSTIFWNICGVGCRRRVPW